ncbi:hypothetical protein Tco_1306315, partial [Tanacetum coccineum]
AEVKLKANIMVDMPKITGEGYYTCNIRVEYEWKPPRCACCKVFGHVLEECPKNIGVGATKNLKINSQTPKGIPVDDDSEDEVASVINEMTSFLAKKDSYGTQSLLEQWKESHELDDYEYDPYDDDMYKGQEIPEMLQAFCDNLVIKVRGSLTSIQMIVGLFGVSTSDCWFGWGFHADMVFKLKSVQMIVGLVRVSTLTSTGGCLGCYLWVIAACTLAWFANLCLQPWRVVVKLPVSWRGIMNLCLRPFGYELWHRTMSCHLVMGHGALGVENIVVNVLIVIYRHHLVVGLVCGLSYLGMTLILTQPWRVAEFAYLGSAFFDNAVLEVFSAL